MVLKKSTSLISGTVSVFFSSIITLKRTFRREDERGGHAFVPLSEEDLRIESRRVPSVLKMGWLVGCG